MIKSKTTEFIDSILLLSVTCFFGITLVAYFSSNTIVTIACGITIGLCTLKICKHFNSKKKSDIDKKTYDAVMLQFFLLGDAWSLNYFFNALSRFKPILANDHLIIDKTAIYIKFKSSNFTFGDLCNLYSNNEQSVDKIVIFSNNFDSDVISTCSLLQNIEFKLINGENSFRLLSKLKAIPECKIELKKKNKPLLFIFSTALRPDKCKRYLFVSFTLICASLIMPSPIYYIVFSAVCLTLAFLSIIDFSTRIIPKRK